VFQRPYPVHDDAARLLSVGARIGASSEWTGRNVTLAFIDSGFYPHPDYMRRVRVHVELARATALETRRYRVERPQSWHGTMVAAVAAGDGEYPGLAPRARLALIAVMDAQGRLKERDILRGLRWVLEQGDRFRVRVVNLSVGGDVPSRDPGHPIYAAIRALDERGVVVVAAAGNGAQGRLVPPASAPEAITVGGVDDHNSPDSAHWTLYNHNHGAAFDGAHKPEVLAPARWVPSPFIPGSALAREAAPLAHLLALGAQDEADALHLLKRTRRDPGLTRAQVAAFTPTLHAAIQARISERKVVSADYQYAEGTSVAAAITSGLVAQMLEANPGLAPRQIKDILRATARPLPGVPAELQGAGVIQPALALAAAQQSSPKGRR
jgi:serine protease AprX